MKKILIVLMILATLLSLVSCKDSTNEGTGIITVGKKCDKADTNATWETQEYVVKAGDVISWSTGMDTQLKIKEIRDNYVVMVSNAPLSSSSRENDTINLRSEQTEFRVDRGETLYLSTCTMDYSEEYKVVY